MNQTTIFNIESITLICEGEDCHFQARIKDPKSLYLPQIRLLNTWVNFASSALTQEQIDNLHLLIEGEISCPVHGRGYLTFSTNETLHVTTDAFVIKSPSYGARLIAFVQRLLFRAN